MYSCIQFSAVLFSNAKTYVKCSQMRFNDLPKNTVFLQSGNFPTIPESPKSAVYPSAFFQFL